MKVQNRTGLVVDLEDRSLAPAETAEVSETNTVRMLIGAGTLTEVEAPAEPAAKPSEKVSAA